MRDNPQHDYAAVLETPFGKLGVRCDETVVHELVFLPARTPSKPAVGALAKRVTKQVERYLQDPSADFDLPLRSVGTDFQQRVWQQISAIPAGTTRSYGDWPKRSAARRVRSGRRAGRIIIRW